MKAFLSRLKTKVFASAAAPAPIMRAEPALEPAARPPLRIDPTVLAWAHRTAASHRNEILFRPAEHPPGVAPSGTKLAMDEAPGVGAWAAAQFGAAYGLSDLSDLAWPGWTVLVMLSQRGEYRNIVQTLAREQTREWIKISATGDDDKADRVGELEKEFERLKVRDNIRRMLEMDGYQGRGHLYIDLGVALDDEAELTTDIGDGSDGNGATDIKVVQGSLKALRTVEAMWIYPIDYNTSNPLAPDWYRPQSWLVQGKKVHKSRLLTLVSREVPDLLKPAYSFGGLSMSQIARPYVDNWLRTRQSVSDLLHSFSVSGLKTNLGSSMQNVGVMQARAEFFNGTRDNRGLMLIDKETEEFFNVSTPLGTLDHLQAQSQEQMASICGIPLVKLLGVTPSGLNASSEGEIASFDDTIAAAQEAHLRPVVDPIFRMAQRNLWGEVDADLTYAFQPLRQMTQKELAEISKIKADTGDVLINAGVISQQEERQRVASDPESPYAGLDRDQMPDLLEEEQDGLADRDLSGQGPRRDDRGGDDDRNEPVRDAGRGAGSAAA